jgi:hypothetical protein
MPILMNEIPTDEALRCYLDEHFERGLLGSAYASAYPECDAFCAKAREAIYQSLST